jgi:hypothetical protein
VTFQNEKRFLIQAYFDNIEARLERLRRIADQSFTEEALILACCYLNGLAQARFVGVRDDTKLFTDLLRSYGGHPELFERVSRVEIIHRVNSDPFAPKELHEHAAVSQQIVTRFGDSASVNGDPTEAELLNALAAAPCVDPNNLKVNLWRYTYGAILYRRWRSPGVHAGEIDGAWDVETGQKVFPVGDDGAGSYYNTFGRLTFSATLVMDTLHRAFISIRAECLEKGAFPPELAA